MFDYLIVGAGFYGSTIARILTDAGKKCLVIDKRPHIGGMACDQKMHGINVSLHGAHITHSHNEEIWQFLNRFSKFNSFINKPKVLSGKDVYSFPINMMTLHQLWGVITPQEALEKLNSVKIKCDNPRNLEEWALSMVGRELYDKFIYGYTKKQWFKEPCELPSSIIQRLPIRLTYEENYFTTKYQGMPVDGYNVLIENMLEGIEVQLEVDFFNLDWRKKAKFLIYTGPIDKFFDYELGKLEYNTLKFEHKVVHGDYQGNAVFNFTDVDVPYLRIVEHKHFYDNGSLKHYKDSTQESSIISYDIPVPYDETQEPYYPIRDAINSELYQKYNILASRLNNVIMGGRLGQYQYFDIDQTVAAAIVKARKLLNV